MHSQQFLGVLNTKGSYARSSLTPDDLLGPLDSLYDFGEMGTVYPPDPTLRPVALLGADSTMLGSCPNFHDAASSGWRSKLIGEESNIHLTVEACDPKSGLRWYDTFKRKQQTIKCTHSFTSPNLSVHFPLYLFCILFII